MNGKFFNTAHGMVANNQSSQALYLEFNNLKVHIKQIGFCISRKCTVGQAIATVYISFTKFLTRGKSS